MSARLSGKKALVTGAAQGLGAAAALAMARQGALVLLTDRNAEQASKVTRVINEELGGIVTFAARHDVTSQRDWADIVQLASEKLGGLSVLVNNAGIALTGSVEDFTLDEWRHGSAVNVDSVFLGVKAALPLMRDHQPGSIINLSSIAGLIAAHNFANYNATKAAVWLLSKSIALHCARSGWDIRTRAMEDGEDRHGVRYRLTGNKMWISGGDQDASDNIVHLVLAKIAGSDGSLPEGSKGISLFIVPKILPDGSRNDVVVAGLNHKLGYRGTSNCLLNFGEDQGAIGWRVRPQSNCCQGSGKQFRRQQGCIRVRGIA